MTEKSDHATSQYHAQHSIAYTATENSDDSLIVHSIVPCVTLAAVVYVVLQSLCSVRIRPRWAKTAFLGHTAPAKNESSALLTRRGRRGWAKLAYVYIRGELVVACTHALPTPTAAPRHARPRSLALSSIVCWARLWSWHDIVIRQWPFNYCQRWMQRPRSM